jgi:hypothetical protein
MNWKFFVVLSFALAACQTQPEDNTSKPYPAGERSLEREDVIPMETHDQITSETNNFNVIKTDQTIHQAENIFEKLRFRKLNVKKNIREMTIPLETIEIYPIDKKSNSEAIQKANLKLSNLLQKWFDLNYDKLSEYAPTQKTSPADTLNEVQINFLAKNSVQIEISSHLEGLQPISEEIPLTDEL